MEVLPEVLRNYGRAVQHGNRNIYQSLPRMLTIWFQYGDYCCANAKHADNRVRSISPSCLAVRCSFCEAESICPFG